MSARDGKPCARCGASEWNKGGSCKTCNSIRCKEWRAANHSKYLANVKKWKEANHDRVRDGKIKWVNENREKRRVISNNWKKRNRDKCNALDRIRETRTSGAGGSHTAQEFRALCEQYNNRCLKCGRDDVPMTADHIIPVSRGGTSNIDNIQPLCQSCNSSKQDKIADYRTKPALSKWVQKRLLQF